MAKDFSVGKTAGLLLCRNFFPPLSFASLSLRLSLLLCNSYFPFVCLPACDCLSELFWVTYEEGTKQRKCPMMPSGWHWSLRPTAYVSLCFSQWTAYCWSSPQKGVSHFWPMQNSTKNDCSRENKSSVSLNLSIAVETAPCFKPHHSVVHK